MYQKCILKTSEICSRGIQSCQSKLLNYFLVSMWKNNPHTNTHTGEQNIKIDTDGRSGKLRFHLSETRRRKQLCTHTPPFLTTKQPEQLAAPLEPGEGKRSCSQKGGERGSQTQRQTWRLLFYGEPLCCYVECPCAARWRHRGHFRQELMNCGWTILHFAYGPELTYKLLLISFCHLLGCQPQE